MSQEQYVPRIDGRSFKVHAASPPLQTRMYLRSLLQNNSPKTCFGAVSHFGACGKLGSLKTGTVGTLNTSSLLLSDSKANTMKNCDAPSASMSCKEMGSLASLDHTIRASATDMATQVPASAVGQLEDKLEQAERMGVITQPLLKTLIMSTATELQKLEMLEVRCIGIGRVIFHEMPSDARCIMHDVTFSRDKITGIPAVDIKGYFANLSATVVLEHAARNAKTGEEVMCSRKRDKYSKQLYGLPQTKHYDTLTNEWTFGIPAHGYHN